MFDRSRRRLAYWFTLSMGSILILFAFTVYQRQVTERRQEFDEEVYVLAKKIADRTKYKWQNKSWQVDLEKAPLPNLATFERGDLVCIRWYDERSQLTSIGKCPQKNFFTSKWQTVEYQDEHSRFDLRILTLPLEKDKSLTAYLQVAVSLERIHNSQKRSLLFLAVGIPVTLIITGLAGWLLAGYAMRPIKHSYEQLQRFTADASHELRAPVAAILSNAQVGLLAPLEDSTQPRQRLENIVVQSKYMSDLITNLLFLARHQGKLNPQDISKIDLAELLDSLAERYQTIAAETGLQFRLDKQGQTKNKNIYGDRDLLHQAIHNLLDNAFKYTPAGGTISLKLNTKPRRVFIIVADTGSGIPAPDLAHIFDRFYRVDKTRTRQTGGFGLGLAIAQQIVLAHGGKITVASEVGRGTTFQICLPVNLTAR